MKSTGTTDLGAADAKPQTCGPPNEAALELSLAERVTKLLEMYPPNACTEQEFLGGQFDLGLAWVHFPQGCGGLGISARQQREVNESLLAAGAPTLTDKNFIGYGMAAPTLVAHGTHEQKSRHLRSIFTGEHLWCQLFSEPGAGSDLASLATKAVRVDGGWLVNGQKVWSTQAHRAQFGLLLARTDPEQPKHKGLTFFVVDMGSPGVDVRPLRQMTGEAEFNEVFLTDALIPDSDRVGAEGEGWQVAMSTLRNERNAIGSAAHSPYTEVVPKLLELWQQSVRSSADGGSAARRDDVVRLWCKAQALKLSEQRASELQQTDQPGPEGSIMKLMTAEITLAATELAVDVMGLEGALYPSGYTMHQPDEVMRYENPQQFFLRCRSVSIGGGTSEVQKNIIAERVLGMPRESSDNDIPWSQIRKS